MEEMKKHYKEMEEILSTGTLRFLKETKSVIKKIEGNGLNETEDSPDVLKKINIIAENFDLLVNRFKNSGTATDEFMKGFKLWNKKQRNSIGKLREIVEVIKSERFYCNISKLAGNITSLTGGGVVLASAIIIPLTGGLAIPAGISAGTFMTAAGTVTSFGTSVAELYLQQENVAKIKKIINEEKELLGTLSKWMEYSDELIAAQSEVLKIDIAEDMIPGVEKLVKEGMEIKNYSKRLRYLEETIKEIIRRTTKSKHISEKATLTVLSPLIGIYAITSNALSQSRFLFDCASLTVKITTTTAIVLMDDIVDLAGLDCTKISKKVATSARGTLAVIGMILDTASVILTSIDLHSGSLSSEAKKIIDVAKAMEKEANILKNVYNNLKKNRLRSPKNTPAFFSLETFLSFIRRNPISCFVFFVFVIWFYFA